MIKRQFKKSPKTFPLILICMYKGVLMEMFVLPYMEHFNKPEIFNITETNKEEITDWYICEQIWEQIEPKVVANFNAEPVIRRA